MKLGKLLAAGKSIVNGCEKVSYRASKQVYLPKFGSPKNPFKPAETETEKPPLDAAAAPVKSRSAAKTQKLPTVFGSRPAKTNWGKLNPISIFRAAPAESARPVVQTELSLDSVKVVHNDLSDADVEVVPIKSRSNASDLPPSKNRGNF